MRKPSLIIVAILLFAAPPTGFACFMYSPQPVQVWLDHVQVDVRDQVAVKFYDCTFKNPNPQAIVGATCYMELEPGAKVDNMSVIVDGKETEAEILSLDKANKVFKDIVKNGGSPALLEYYGNQLIRTKVPRIAPNGLVKVKLRYTMALKKKGNIVRMQLLNTNPKANLTPLKSASVTVNLTSTTPIKNIYSPTHGIKLVETEKADISVQWKQDNYLPKHPFVLYYSVADDKVGASVIAHRDIKEDPGSFMLMLSPTFGTGKGAVTDKQILPKDVVFCVDTSGSMLQGNKMEQARAALKHCIGSLRPNDRFNIVDFSTEARSFADEMMPANDKNLALAQKYADHLRARGGTAIEEALSNSLKLLGKTDRLKMVLFATDGLPTIGERNPEALLRKMAKQNTEDVRLFVFGEGYDVNARLLDFMAQQNRGETDYILPTEKIDEKIARFFDRVGSPIMTNLELEFEDTLGVEDVYPKRIADIFKSEQVIVYGRYNGSGEKKVRLSGYINGERQTFEYTLKFPEYSNDDNNAFVPRLWGGAKVDFMLNEIRKSGKEDAELVNEITRLAKLYGIVTPYTAYLMTNDIAGPNPTGKPAPPGIAFRGKAANRAVLESLKTASADEDAAAADPAARKEAVDRLAILSRARRQGQASGGASALYEYAEREMKKKGREGSSLAAIRYIGSRTFYNAANVWYEGGFDPDKHKTLRKVKVGSDDYMDMLSKNPRIAQYLALGNVIVNDRGTWTQITTN